MALFFEAKINTEDRNNLPDSAFGLPSKRKYPLTDKDGNLDEKHILQAVRFFNKADDDDKEELAKNILKAAKELGMDYSNWKDVLKYAGEEDVIKESYDPQPDGDHTSGTSDFDHDDNDPDDCYCESGNNVSETEAFYKRWKDKEGTAALNQAKEIVKKIAEKVKEDEQPPCGNQNCQLCTWCVEAQFRNINALPRPVYSPRDPALGIKGETIVKDPQRISIQAGYDNMLDYLMEPAANVARFYCHVNWNNSTGGHEFIILKIGKQNFYIVDAQAGIVEPLSDTGDYFNDINFGNSFICRLDNHDFNKELFEKYNDPKSLVPWDGRIDIPYMLERGMLSEEEAKQYWNEHPDEAPKEMSGSKNIFTSGDFDKYGKDVNLDDARGPITESKKIIDSRDERTLSQLICEGWKIAGTINNEYILIKEGYEDTNDFPAYVGFRPATEKDLDMILEWTLETINDEYRHDQKVIDMINDENRENINTIKIIVDGVKDIGMYQAYPIDEGEWWYLAEIYLIPEYRGKGIGSYLIKKDIESHDKLVLRVNPDNVRAIKLYESLGFVITEKEENSWIMRLDKTKNGSYQEGYWQDIKNGVNPKSKKLWFHVSFDDKLDEKGPMIPRIPTWLEDIKKDGYTTSDGKKTHDLDEVMRDTGRYENYTTPRVCFSPSIEGALNSIINIWKIKDSYFPGKQLYVYIPEKPLSQYKHKTNKELIKDKEVFDAGTTGESWILEPVKVKFYGSINVDKVKDNGRKHKVLVRPGFEKETDNPMDNYIGRFTYKWHWMIHPSIIKQGEKYEKSEKHAQSPLEVCNDIVAELKDFKYGIVKDGKLSISNNSIEDYDTLYKFMTLDEFEKYRGGICYDYVEWEESYLKDHGKKYSKYYLYANTDNNDTHTFILVKNNDGYIYIESAFKIIEGVYPVKNLQEAVDIITKAMFKMNGNNKLNSFNYYVWEYKGHPEYGSSIKQCEEYYIKGKFVLEGTATNPKKK